MENSKHKKTRIALMVLGALALVLVAVFSAYMAWERPPETPAPESSATPAPVKSSATPSPQPMPQGKALKTERQDGMYTILLVGNDQISGNTDTVMLGRLDTRRHQLNFVSLPRDTLLNVDWDVRKLNAVYAGAVNNGGEGIEALLMHVKWLTGIQPDCYAVVDLDVFMDAVDTVGGVYFDVPVAMDYDDYFQNLFIHLQPGYQKLNGYQAMGLCRFREDYTTGDIGRIEMQHAFLKSCAKQFISLGNVPNARKLVQLVSRSVETDLTGANMAWLMRQVLLCDEQDVNFYTAPSDGCLLQGYWYAVLRLDEWLPMINEHINPYDSPITSGNLNVVFRRGDRYASTGGLQGEWYFVAPPSPTPSPRPSAAPPEEGEDPDDPPTPPPTPAPSPTTGPTIIEVIITPSPSPVPGE